MANKKYATNMTDLLPECMNQTDPMLAMPEWLCAKSSWKQLFQHSLEQRRALTAVTVSAIEASIVYAA